MSDVRTGREGVLKSGIPSLQFFLLIKNGGVFKFQFFMVKDGKGDPAFGLEEHKKLKEGWFTLI